jgi:hypothetical protein
MRKLMITGVLLGLLTAGIGATSAEARDRGCHDGRRDRAGYAGGYYGRSAWDVVRSDPCLYDEYARYARKHKNPNKRARKIEELAREGCPRRAEYDAPYDGGDDHWGYDRRPVYDPDYANPYYAPRTGHPLDLVPPLLGLLLGR